MEHSRQRLGGVAAYPINRSRKEACILLTCTIDHRILVNGGYFLRARSQSNKIIIKLSVDSLTKIWR